MEISTPTTYKAGPYQNRFVLIRPRNFCCKSKGNLPVKRKHIGRKKEALQIGINTSLLLLVEGTHGTAPVGTDKTKGAVGRDISTLDFYSVPAGRRSKNIPIPIFHAPTARCHAASSKGSFSFGDKTPFSFSTEKENGVLYRTPPEAAANLLYPAVHFP